jgi:hypothetical protein
MNLVSLVMLSYYDYDLLDKIWFNATLNKDSRDDENKSI